MEEQKIVDKLKSPLREIRDRALENISDKIEYELIDMNPFVDNTDICQVIMSWFEDTLISISEAGVKSKSTLPDLNKIFKIILTMLEKSINGKSQLEGLNAFEILESWQMKYEKFQEPEVKASLKSILEVLNAKSDESQLVSTYGASLRSTFEDETSSCQKKFIGQQSNLSLPQHLLKSTLTNRNYSPVARNYVKRVHFDENFENEDEEHRSSTIKPSPFSWMALAKDDRDKINLLHSALTSYKPEVIRDACIELTSEIFEDFPAEIFTQRPEIVFALQDVLMMNSNPALKTLAAQALSRLCVKLQMRFKLCQKVQSSRKDSILLMSLPQSCHKNDSSVDNIEDDNSFADQINTTSLKRLQLEPYEYCLMILSSAATVFQHLDQMKPANACIELFQNGMDLSKIIFDQDLKGESEIAESVKEIQGELLKSLLMHQNNRVIFLMLLKTSIEFLKISDHLDVSLTTFLQSCSLDSTLYLSHKHLHDQIVILEDFKQVEEMMSSMKHSIKVLQNTQETFKVSELIKALPGLRFHENYKKFIPLVLQTARSLRDKDKIMQMSTLVVKLLTFPDSKVCQETLFQLHSLVQDILGIGQALDIDGTKKLELSFLIYDRGEIVKELLKCSLDNEDHVKKASIEIVLYLLKAEKFLGWQLWKTVNQEIIKPNLALLECCVQEDDQVSLSRWIFCHLTDGISHFEGSLRILLTSLNSSLRSDAQANLRTILSKQPQSQTKLPKFVDILKIDISDLAMNYPPINLSLRTAKNQIMEHMSVKDLLDLIRLSPDYDILSKKAALQHLTLLLETDSSNDFIELRGLDLILELLDKCLDENGGCMELSPYVLESLKAFFVHQSKFINDFKQDKETYSRFLYAYSRSLYLHHNHKEVLDQIMVVLMLVLFHDWLKLENSVISMPKFMLDKLNFRISVEEAVLIEDDLKEPPNEALGILKVYWNMAWFGGIHILKDWTSPKGDSQFSSKLYLDPLELAVVKNSFSESVIEDLGVKINDSKTHGDFHDALQLARAHYKLIEKR